MRTHGCPLQPMLLPVCCPSHHQQVQGATTTHMESEARMMRRRSQLSPHGT